MEQKMRAIDQDLEEEAIRKLSKIEERAPTPPPRTDEERDKARKTEQVAKAVKFRRTQSPPSNAHAELATNKKLKQNTDDIALIPLRFDPDYKLFIRIEHQMNYEDEGTPDKRPYNTVHVELTHHDTRAVDVTQDR
jgi:hypothetical protein